MFINIGSIAKKLAENLMLVVLKSTCAKLNAYLGESGLVG